MLNKARLCQEGKSVTSKRSLENLAPVHSQGRTYVFCNEVMLGFTSSTAPSSGLGANSSRRTYSECLLIQLIEHPQPASSYVVQKSPPRNPQNVQTSYLQCLSFKNQWFVSLHLEGSHTPLPVQIRAKVHFQHHWDPLNNHCSDTLHSFWATYPKGHADLPHSDHLNSSNLSRSIP